jgi:hypothetical protein
MGDGGGDGGGRRGGRGGGVGGGSKTSHKHMFNRKRMSTENAKSYGVLSYALLVMHLKNLLCHSSLHMSLKSVCR